MTLASAPAPPCSACAEVSGDIQAPGGAIADDGLPRPASMPRGHVISDLYRRARNLLRQVGVLRNPTAEAWAEAAAQVRQAWEEPT